jgi:hypothetical protein
MQATHDRIVPPTDRAPHVRALARVLDSAVRVPGTPVRFGLDAVLGLVPGLGDVAGAGLSAWIVMEAARLGAPRSVLLRMLLNVGIDAAAGVVPVAGDLFDLGWKANVKNAALLERHLAEPGKARAASRGVLVAVLAGLGLIAAAGIALAVVVVRWLWGMLF